eukprot:2775652-Prymnesium_polylepis.1
MGLTFCVTGSGHAGSGLWPMVRRKAVLERYAALRCLWHEVHDDERSNRYKSSCAIRVALVRQYRKRGA